jgi:hypothetical protein
MGFLDFIQQDDTVRLAADFLGQLAAVVVTDIAGGEPISLLTVCGSMNSDMSSRTMASSLSNMASATALTSSVLPTPVGPTKMNDAGLCFLPNPARLRRIALASAETAFLADHALMQPVLQMEQLF